MLECRVHLSPGEVVRDVDLDLAAHVLQGREAGLAHYPLQHHSPGHGHAHRLRLQLRLGLRAVVALQLGSEVRAPKIVRKRIAGGAQLAELGAPLGDDLVVVARRFAVVLHDSAPARVPTPCFRLAVMKSSRSPSRTACVLPISTPVRRSLMRDWSSTYERI